MAETDSTPLEISSVEDGVYRALRQEIGASTSSPASGSAREIARRFQVSLTPVRHALRRLESEGLVVSLHGAGRGCAPLSVEELEEIQALRLGLETFLARRGAEAITDEALAEMTAARDEMKRAFRAGDLDAYLASFWSLRDGPATAAPLGPGSNARSRTSGSRVERYVLTLCRIRKPSPTCAGARTPCSRPAGPATARLPRRRPATRSSGCWQSSSACSTMPGSATAKVSS